MQREAAFFNCWGPEEYKVLPVGAGVCQIVEVPGLRPLDPGMQSVDYAQCAIEKKNACWFSMSPAPPKSRRDVMSKLAMT